MTFYINYADVKLQFTKEISTIPAANLFIILILVLGLHSKLAEGSDLAENYGGRKGFKNFQRLFPWSTLLCNYTSISFTRRGGVKHASHKGMGCTAFFGRALLKTAQPNHETTALQHCKLRRLLKKSFSLLKNKLQSKKKKKTFSYFECQELSCFRLVSMCLGGYHQILVSYCKEGCCGFLLLLTSANCNSQN